MKMKKQIAGRFFEIYFAVIMLVLAVQLLSCKTLDFEQYDLGTGFGSAYEILDGHSVEAVFQIPQEAPHGILLNYFDKNELEFSDEKLHVSIYDADGGEELQTTEFLLKEEVDEKSLYVKFQEAFPSGRRLGIRIWSEGLSENGPKIAFSGTADTESVLKIDGVRSLQEDEKYLCATLCYAAVTYNYQKPLLYFAAEILLGIVLLYFNKKEKLPLFAAKRESGLQEGGRKGFLRRKDLLRMAGRLACLWLAAFVFFDAVYTMSVETALDKRDAYKMADGAAFWSEAEAAAAEAAEDEATVAEELEEVEAAEAQPDEAAAAEELEEAVEAEPEEAAAAEELEEAEEAEEAVEAEPEEAAAAEEPEEAEEAEAAQTVAALSEGEEFSQTFYAANARLSGIALQITDWKSLKGKLRCRIYREDTEELVVEKTYKISSLKNIVKYLPNDIEKWEKRKARKYAGLNFGTILGDSADGYYRLVLSVEDTEGESLPLTLTEEDGSLDGVLLYSNNRFLKKFFVLTALVVVAFLSITLVLVTLRRIHLEGLFLVSMLVLGMLFGILIPPYCVPDERAHIDSAYRISNELLGIEESPAPYRTYKRICDFDASRENTMDVTAERYREVYEGLTDLWVKDGEDELAVVWTDDAIGNVTKLNYLPAAIGFSIARVCGMNHIAMVMLGRMFTLLVSAMLMYWGVRKLPFGKTVFAVVGLLPITLQQMASCSYDGILLGSAYVFIGYCLSLAYGNDRNIWDLGVMSYAGAFLTACKVGVYLPLVGLILLIPFADRKKPHIKELAGMAGIGISVLMVFLAQFLTRILSTLTRTAGNAHRSGTVEQIDLYTMSYFIRKPVELIRLVQNTFLTFGDTLIKEVLGGRLGRLNVTVHWYTLLSFFALLLFCALKEQKERQFVRVGTRIWVTFLCAASTFLVMLSMALVWTEKGNRYISGIQGRYLLPIAGLLLLLLRNDTLVYRKKKRERLIWLAGVCNLLAVGDVFMSLFY